MRHPAGDRRRRRAAAPERRTRRPRRSASGCAASKADTSDRQLNPVDAAAVDALPAGHALLVVQRGPGAGSRFLLDADVVTAGRHPDSEIFLDDVTVSRRHAEFHREGDDVHRQRRRQPQRHLRQPRPHRPGRAQGRRRGPDRQVPPGLLLRARERLTHGGRRSAAGARPRAVPRPDEHRGGARPAAPGLPGVTIPKIRFLEDKGLIKPERTPAGYRKFSADDVDRLRYVLRMQRDHYLPLQGDRRAPRRHRPRPRAAADRRRRARPCRQVALAADGLPSAGVVRAPRPPAALAQGAAQDRRDLRGAARPARAVRPDHAARRHRPLRHRRPGRSPGPRASWPTSASSRATCARSRPPPTARSAWSSRSSRPTSAAATPPPRPGPRRPSARSPRSRCGCTRPWSRPASGAT